MQHIVTLALTVALAGSQSVPPPSFAGLWRLVDPTGAPASMPEELLVIESEPARLAIQLMFPSGVRSARFSIAEPPKATRGVAPASQSRTPAAAFRNATWNGVSLAMKSTQVVQSAASGSAAQHEEMWSLGADGVLYVDVVDRSVGVSAKTSRVHYRRVPVQATMPPGQSLLRNSTADQGVAFWAASGVARVEPCDGSACFVVRNGGSFNQTVLLPKDVVGKYLVLIASGAGERIHEDGTITDLPTLYGLVGTADGTRYVAHLQGMLGRPAKPGQWVTMSGVFRVPEGAAMLHFQLNQASSAKLPHTGSAARFDDPGVYVFASESEARAFIEQWRGRDR